jgi:hypothetical protein
MGMFGGMASVITVVDVVLPDRELTPAEREHLGMPPKDET